jgi:outer membrane protein assembly factor BamB
VDTFDFPLNPPFGEGVSARFGFGSYSNRYEKYHAGEDWGFTDAPNFGKSVYSIGHGQVTYAAPNGWGLDRGTVVIRHVFPWGGYVLSFYGHLDPPSVTLRAGDCVERGDKVGEIGRPRTSPHLHFEIRLHLPVSAGHGYWSTDPAGAGWLPPSQTIWSTRIAASPGVLWTLPSVEGLTQGLGIFQDSLVLIRGGKLSAVDPDDGTQVWSQPISETIRTALLDPLEDQVYQLDLGGDLTAYPLPGPSQPEWKADINAFGSAELIPFPNGGVLVADRRRAVGVSPAGEIFWDVEIAAPVSSWISYGDDLIFTTSGTDSSLWSATKSGLTPWGLQFSGKLSVSGDGIYLYAEDGLYRLNVSQQTAELLMELPGTIQKSSDLAARTRAGFLVVWVDRADRRLLAVDLDGVLLWERSIAALPRGELRLISLGEAVYLENYHRDSTGIQVDLYAIDQQSGNLTHIFNGGSRQSYSRDVWLMFITTDRLLVNIDAGALAMFDPHAAFERISTP